jgi:hypothetical protein
MHDQPRDPVNGRSMVAFATICERKLDMASVLKSADGFGVGAGMHRCLRIRQEEGSIFFRADHRWTAD